MNKLKGAANYVWREGTVYIILAFLIILFSILNPVFFSGRNFYNLLTQSTYYIIAGMGIAFAARLGAVSSSFCVEQYGTQLHRFDADTFRARYEAAFGPMPVLK